MTASAIVILAAATASADEIRLRQGKFADCKQDKDGVHVVEVSLKDGTSWPVDPGLTAADQRTIDATLLPLLGQGINVNIILKLNDKNNVVGVEKGLIKDAMQGLAPALQARIKAANQGDEICVVTTSKREVFGKFDKYTNEGIVYHPALIAGQRTVAGQPAQKRQYVAGVESVAFRDIESFQNVTQETTGNPNQPKGSEVAKNDAVSKQDLRVGDTVRIGFMNGQISKLTDTTLELREWKGGAWGDARSFDRATLPEVRSTALLLRRSYPVNANGEVVVEEERRRESKSNQLKLTGRVWHDQQDSILAGATVAFAAGPSGSNLAQAQQHEEIVLPAVFFDERVVVEKILDQEDGQVTLVFEPARHLLSAASPDAKPFIVTALATKTEPAALSRVYEAAAKNGDRELALILVNRYVNVPQGPERERTQAVLLDALQQFGEKGAQAILDHVLSPDESYKVAEASESGQVVWKDEKDKATPGKKLELHVLATIPGAAAGDRGKKLFRLYEERSAELGEAVLKVFVARTGEAIDALLDVAISLTAKPTPDETKRADDAANLIRNLGDKGLDNLIQRVKADGPRGLPEAKKLEGSRHQTPPRPVGEIIDLALMKLIDWKKEERRAALARTLEDAKARATEKKWDEALAIVENVLQQDREHDEARKLLYDYLVCVADLRIEQKLRGDAHVLLQRVYDDKQPGRGAEGRIAKILLEAALEDLNGNCVRRDPDTASEVVKKVEKDAVLPVALTKRSADGWVPVKYDSAGSVGWLSLDLGSPIEGGTKCKVTSTSMNPSSIRRTIEEARKLAPELGPALDAVDGELWMRDAIEKRDLAKPKEALASYQQAEKLIPGDARLGDVWKVWCQANLNILMILGGALVLVAGLSVLFLKRRQKRVKVGEFRYYGRDRARAERELDGGAAAAGAASPAEGEPPPAAPPA